MNHSLNFKDLTGKKYGRWIVLSLSSKKVRRCWFWNCQCDCGKIKEVSSNCLRNGSMSCGCYKKEQLSLPRVEIEKLNKSNMNSVKARYKSDAKKRNLSWELENEDFYILTKSNCFYCNIEPSNTFNGYRNNTKYNGIDRVNNLLGYNKFNCVACCNSCNSKKKSITPEMIKKCYNFLYGVK